MKELRKEFNGFIKQRLWAFWLLCFSAGVSTPYIFELIYHLIKPK